MQKNALATPCLAVSRSSETPCTRIHSTLAVQIQACADHYVLGKTLGDQGGSSTKMLEMGLGGMAWQWHSTHLQMGYFHVPYADLLFFLDSVISPQKDNTIVMV